MRPLSRFVVAGGITVGGATAWCLATQALWIGAIVVVLEVASWCWWLEHESASVNVPRHGA
jgi:hypothetical protein